MEIVVLGLSHKTAPVDLREKLAFPGDTLEPALRRLAQLPHVREGLIVSTCNRVEAVAGVESPAALPAIRHFMAEARGVSPELFAEHAYEHAGREAVRHLFRVASSLDSMVVGEPQILGQVKDAYGAAQHAGTLGALLDRCLTRAFAVAKKVRSETRIAAGAASISSVAVDLAERIFGKLDGRLVLVIGAGEMADLAARHLHAAGCADLLCVNRTYERAVELAARVEGQARRWEEFDGLLGTVDIVISSTGAREPILGYDRVARVMKARRHRSLFLIDIAVPRDIEARVGDLDNVYRFDIDDLEKVVAENLKERQKEAARAEKIVEAETSEFLAWLKSQGVVPVIKQLRERFTQVARGEVERTLASLPSLGERERRSVQAMADAIVNKLLHPTLTALKREGAGEGGEELAQATRRLFALPAEAEGDAAATEPGAVAPRPEEKVTR
ncbi:MAG: glutamyl-tRNA reductase [Deltaproteobacteria bacterium]|nr:glutamyl-tRNA reductase [Deltaproteobacteria bacterium]